VCVCVLCVCVYVCMCVCVYVCVNYGRGERVKEAKTKCLKCKREDGGTKSFFRNVTKFTSLPKVSHTVHTKADQEKAASIVQIL
jgi:hypothetical protein